MVTKKRPNSGTNTDSGIVAPDFQPRGFDPKAGEHKFETSEIWWWNNGVWGQAGYAIPNDGGKPTTSNEAVHGLHDFIGAELFNLMHRPDVRFSRPFNIEWLRDLNKTLKLGMKRLGDYAVSFTDERQGDADHNENTPRAFTVYPVPFFGNRIRQKDARRWCGWILQLLGEIMQHSDNDFHDDVTDFLASKAQVKLARVYKDMAMKYFGFSRAEVDDPAWIATGIPDDRFARDAYDPTRLFTDREMTEERMPTQWWPATNDLTPINGIDALHANTWATRWPEADNFDGDGGASEAAFPGGGTGVRLVGRPGRAKA